MFLELAAGAFLLSQFIYHRFIADQPNDVDRADEADIPITEEGQARQLVFGRCRVKRPVLAWIDQPHAYAGSGVNAGKTVYSMSMLFVIGAGFDRNQGTNRLHSIWVGDLKLARHAISLSGGVPVVNLDKLDGNGDFEDLNRQRGLVTSRAYPSLDGELFIGGAVEFLNGKPTQELIGPSPTYTFKTRAANQMCQNTGTSEDHLQGNVDPSLLTSYRGVMSALLYGFEENHNNLHFNYGLGPQLGAFSFEVSSYHTNHAQLGTYARVGNDSNPVNVIFDILTSTQGKLGLSPNLIDITNFQQIQYTLHTESHGFSYAFEERMSAAHMIEMVLRQIDGVIYVDQATGKIKLGLVRADFSPPDLFEINKTNCVKLSNFAAGGRSNLVNKVKVVFMNAEKDYTEDSAVAQNMANAVGQDGQVVEEVVEYRGTTRANQAAALAARELAARSRPVIKCRAICDRKAVRVVPGQAVRLVYTNPDVAGIVFRVAAVDRGTPEDGAIAIDLVQDASYVWRGGSAQPPDFGASDGGLDAEIGP